MGRILLGFLLILLFISCTNEKKETNKTNAPLLDKETAQKKSNETTAMNTDRMMENLQGEWKEREYPFRRAHFKKATVKFTEEGVVEEPRFQAFSISNHCPFAVNNLKNAGPGDLFLVRVEAGTCEIVKVSGDLLTLSGFSTNTKSDYKIVYAKVK